MKDYKKLYYNDLIAEEEKKRFSGWFFCIMLPAVIIFVWLFGVPELWPLKQKIWLTIVGGVVTLIMGYWQVKGTKEEIKKLKKELNG
jgi:cytochrome c biogenesis protein CcdA